MRAARLLFILTLLAAPAAHAGRGCTEVAPSPEAARKALTLGLRVQEWLDASGARLALIARVGSDLSAHGLRYSHTGYVWRTAPGGPWRVRHLLNHCGTATAGLYEEGLGNFFSDTPFRYEALLAVPAPALQQQLARELGGPHVLDVFEPTYNMLANPWGTHMQNSNQWLLEFTALALAEPGVSDRRSAQAWLAAQGYVPGDIRVSAAERLGATLMAANISFTDHPLATRLGGHYPAVTAESVVDFLAHLDPSLRRGVVALPDPLPAKN